MNVGITGSMLEDIIKKLFYRLVKFKIFLILVCFHSLFAL